MSKSGIRLIPLIVASVLTAACSPGEADQTARERAIKKRQEARQKEALLMAELPAATAELIGRLERNVSVRGGLLVVRTAMAGAHEMTPAQARSRDFWISALPLNSPWTVKCSRHGIEVMFGAASEGEVAEGAGSIGPGPTVVLTKTELTETGCQILVVALGNAVRRLLNTNRN